MGLGDTYRDTTLISKPINITNKGICKYKGKQQGETSKIESSQTQNITNTKN